MRAPGVMEGEPWDQPLLDRAPRAIATVSANPARAAKLDDRGAIEVGLKADMVQVSVVEDVPVVRAVWRDGRRVA